MYYLRKAYYDHKIKKKKIRRTKIITGPLRLKIKDQARQAKKEVNQAIEDGLTIHYVDEFCVTKSTMPTHDWTLVNSSFQIDYKQYHKKTIASIVSISSENGVDLV